VVEQAQKLDAKATIKLGLGLFGSKHFLRGRFVRILDTTRALHSRLSLGAAVLLVGVAVFTLPYVRAQIRSSDQPARQNQPALAIGPRAQASAKEASLVPKATQTQALAIAATSSRNDEGTRRSMEILVVNAKTQQPEPGVTIKYGTHPHKTGMTDKNGRFIFTEEAKNLIFLILTQKPGFVGLQAVWDNASAETPVEIPRQYTVNLEPGSTIGDIVKDEQGRPVSGATIGKAISTTGGRRNGEADVYHTGDVAKSDAAGIWRYDLTPAHLDAVWISVAHPDFAEAIDEMPLFSGSREIGQLQARSHVLILKKGVSIAGKILDQAGRPVEQAEVALYGSRLAKASKTDAQGSFKLDHLMPGYNRLTVKARGYVRATKRVATTAGMAPVEIRLDAGRTLSGLILDESKRPVPDVRVWMETESSDSGPSPWAASDKDGRFHIDGIPAFEVSLRVLRQGMAPFIRRILPTENEITVVTKHELLHVSGNVTDAATGQPLPAFNVVLRGPVNGRHAAKGGHFEQTLDKPEIPFFRPLQIGVEATGYETSGLRNVPTEKTEINIDFQLTKSPMITGVVRAPDGGPIAGAQVGLGSPTQFFYLNDGRLTNAGIYTIGETDASGRFSFPPRPEPFSIVVAHPLGYAIRTTEQLSEWRKSPIEISLQRWARVEGGLNTGGHGRGNEEISIGNSEFIQKSSPKVQYRAKTSTDSQGRFVFERILPGMVAIQQTVPLREGSGMTAQPIAPLELKPGETTRVIVGGRGRPVIGRVTIPATLKNKWELADRDGTISFEVQPPKPYDKLTEAEQARFDREWLRSYRSFRFVIGTDGSFRANEVPQGTYQLAVRVHENYQAANYQGFIPLGSIRRTITIPPIPGGLEYTGQPLDLGSIPLELSKRVEVGSVMPDFEARTLNGKPLRLKDFIGKHTLVIFCRTSFDEIKAERRYLKRLFDSHGKDDRFAMVGVKIYPGSRLSQEEQARASGGWPLAELSDPKEWAFQEAYGTYTLTSIWLIGPDGKVIGRDLEGATINEAMERELGSR